MMLLSYVLTFLLKFCTPVNLTTVSDLSRVPSTCSGLQLEVATC